MLDYLDLGRLSIGEPFYNLTFSPLAIAVGLLLGAGIFSRWKKTDGGTLTRKLMWPAAISLVGAAGVMVAYGDFNPWVFFGCLSAIWVVVATGRDLLDKSASRHGRLHGLKRQSRSYWGMVLGHLGLAMTIAGSTIVSNYGIERDVRMSPGDVATLDDYQFTFASIGEREGANFTAQVARFDVSKNGKAVTILYPEKRQYNVQRNIMTEAGIHARLSRDLFVAIGEPVGTQAWAIRIQYKPMIRWIWLGALFMAAGGFLAIADRRYRIRDKVASPADAKQAGLQPQRPVEAGA